jgi:EpsI family protein
MAALGGKVMNMEFSEIKAENGVSDADVSLPTRSVRSLISRRHFIVGGAMAAAAGIAQLRMPVAVNPRVAKKDFDALMPQKVGPWEFVTASGVVLPPPDELSDRLYDNLASRVYQAEGLPVVMVVFAYNNVQDGVLQLHRPEVCYPAGGYELTPTRPVMLKTPERTIPANFFTAKGYDRTEQVLYWTRVGNRFPLSWREQRLSVARANLQGDIPDGILARVSVISNDQGQALDVLQQFVTALEQAAKPQLKKLLVG